ncbi:MAG: hypothetical protein ABIN01_13365 [Ferruginibacter sp.]
MTGYSGTPLAKKLGIKAGYRIRVINAPEYYFSLFEDMPANVNTEQRSGLNLVHYFSTGAKALQKDLPKLKKEIEESGMIWISWPKKASGVATDITEDTIRLIALSNELVDVKVCAIDEIWSGLKLVIPVKFRPSLQSKK